MSIQILPAILANQIAAGEVVERPASVIKELVENSLDADATQIEVEIDKGGHKRILVRDNGKGIAKQELALALSRHATSKIACLDDLERIISLGFRGEALASISSVARLTLTSRPQQQNEAWQAYAEGREMEVKIVPAAHPQGTSVEVLDLFFNTPARRKFLRTEKTEFNHIEEVIRRIALSRFDVSFSLKHNGKIVRKFPSSNSSHRSFKRVAGVFGSDFSDHAIEADSRYQQLALSGWIAAPSGARNQNDLQYFYVNGRMMRDKLINHAIRQAFEGVISNETYPAYCLYLQLPPDEVDVNVHPAKHEVRFHQARLVHDFIYRAVNDVLERTINQSPQPSESDITIIDSSGPTTELAEVTPTHDYIAPLQTAHARQVSQPAPAAYQANGSRQSTGGAQQAAQNYQQLMQVPQAITSSGSARYLLVGERWALLEYQQRFWKLDLDRVLAEHLQRQFDETLPVSQPLLMPVSLQAEPALIASAQRLYEPLLKLNLEIGWAAQRILVRKVPAGFRQLPWGDLLPDILACEGERHDMLVRQLANAIARFSPTNSKIAALHACLARLDGAQDSAALLNKMARQVALENWLNEHD